MEVKKFKPRQHENPAPLYPSNFALLQRENDLGTIEVFVQERNRWETISFIPHGPGKATQKSTFEIDLDEIVYDIRVRYFPLEKTTIENLILRAYKKQNLTWHPSIAPRHHTASAFATLDYLHPRTEKWISLLELGPEYPIKGSSLRIEQRGGCLEASKVRINYLEEDLEQTIHNYEERYDRKRREGKGK